MMLAMLGASLVVLLSFTAMAVDVANAYVVRGILEHAVDDAARTAQRWSAQVDDPGADPGAVQARAAAAAVDTARREIQAHGLADATVVDSALAGSRLRIAARASIRTWFLPIAGIASWLPSASADVALWTPASASAASGPAAPASGAIAPTFPPASGPVPALTLPEGSAASNGGVQPGDAVPGPGPSDGSMGAPGDAPGIPGGEIAEGL